MKERKAENYKHPIIDNKAQENVRAILQSGLLSGFRASPEYHLGGEYVRRLEDKFCKYFGVKYAVALNSATAGLHSALVACDIGVGDEVIVSPYSFVSSASCVLMVGAKPVFADIEDETFCIDPDKVEITPDTRAIIPVHLMGHPAKMGAIMAIAEHYHLKVIEDAAQAIGSIYHRKFVGTAGDCGIFSFNQSKQISSGEGGMLITNDDKTARKVGAVRNHAEISDPELKIVGYNYRMCEIEAAIALEQFIHLEENIAYRNKLATYMTERLKEINGLTPPAIKDGCRHSFYTYAVKFNSDKMTRDEFQEKMLGRGIYFGKGYVKPIYLLPIFGGELGQCPVAERMWKRELMVFDWLKYPATTKDIDMAIETAKELLNG